MPIVNRSYPTVRHGLVPSYDGYEILDDVAYLGYQPSGDAQMITSPGGVASRRILSTETITVPVAGNPGEVAAVTLHHLEGGESLAVPPDGYHVSWSPPNPGGPGVPAHDGHWFVMHGGRGYATYPWRHVAAWRRNPGSGSWDIPQPQ